MKILKEKYDIAIVGGGAGGLFAAYEMLINGCNKSIAIIEKGSPLKKRKCPIDGDKVKNCIQCKQCSIMTGIGGAGAFSDGKYNITNSFGGNLADYVGPEKALETMEYVDTINLKMGGEGAKRYSTVNSTLKHEALRYDLHLLDAEVRHLGTDKNYEILTNIINFISSYENVDIICNTNVLEVLPNKYGWTLKCEDNMFPDSVLETEADKVIIATGRSGSKWTRQICDSLGIGMKSNRVDIGVRFECPAEVWEPITTQVYESKIMYRSPVTGCTCRTFCMNPHGEVVAENTNGIVTVNGHSYDSPELHTKNTNFALLVSHEFTEPFKDSNAYGESIARLSNMLAGGVMVQRFGDLIKNQRTNHKRLGKSFVRPTLHAEPGNLGLVIPKQTLDTIIEMIYALDKLAPGTANYDNLLYGVEVKFYNSRVEVDSTFETKYKGLYIIGDASGTTHSLSQASAEGVLVARTLIDK